MIQINDWPATEPESDARASAAPASNPVRRLAGLRKIGTAFAWFAGVGAILGGLTGYWSTYRTVTTELLTTVNRAVCAPKCTEVTPVRFDPSMVTGVPPCDEPIAGVIDPMLLFG